MNRARRRRRVGSLPDRVRHGLTRRVVRALRPLARRAGIDLVVGDFYSPVPHVDALPPALWARRSALAGLDFDPAAQLRFLERELASHVAEFDPPLEPTGTPGEFHLRNETYGSVDAEVLYAMVRRQRPRRIVELGSGASSLVIATAARRNAAEGSRPAYVTYDPYPRADLERSLRGATDLRPVSATDVPLADFEALEDGDVLFVDTTHTVKVGGDVNYIVLDVLPALRPGVVVHFHDIFLPFEYPREWVAEHGYYWAEQYLLQAFLAYNDRFEVLFSARAVAREYPAELARVVRSFGPRNRPTSFWLRRR